MHADERYVQKSLSAVHADERFHHAIAQDGSFSIGLVVPRQLRMREWMAGKFKGKYTNLAVKVKDAAKGLLVEVAEQNQQGRKVNGTSKVKWYKKAMWADVTGDAAEEAVRLDLQRDQFHNWRQ